jgi:hypothetical protein
MDKATMDDNARRHLTSTRQLVDEALTADGVQSVALCDEARQELAKAENQLVRAVTAQPCATPPTGAPACEE